MTSSVRKPARRSLYTEMGPPGNLSTIKESVGEGDMDGLEVLSPTMIDDIRSSTVKIQITRPLNHNFATSTPCKQTRDYDAQAVPEPPYFGSRAEILAEVDEYLEEVRSLQKSKNTASNDGKSTDKRGSRRPAIIYFTPAPGCSEEDVPYAFSEAARNEIIAKLAAEEEIKRKLGEARNTGSNEGKSTEKRGNRRPAIIYFTPAPGCSEEDVPYAFSEAARNVIIAKLAAEEEKRVEIERELEEARLFIRRMDLPGPTPATPLPYHRVIHRPSSTPLTVPEPFYFDARNQLAAEEKERKYQEHILSEKKIPPPTCRTPFSKRLTIPEPFSFQARNEVMADMKEQHQKEYTLLQTKIPPPTCNIPYSVRLTVPEPFYFDARNELAAEEKERKYQEHVLSEKKIPPPTCNIPYSVRLTVPEPFYFDARNELAAEEKERKYQEHVLSEKKIPPPTCRIPYSIRLTLPEPFSFAARDQQTADRIARQRMEHNLQEKKMTTPSSRRLSLPHKLTVPEPFSFTARDERLLEKRERQRMDTSLQERKTRSFRASPLPSMYLTPSNRSRHVPQEVGASERKSIAPSVSKKSAFKGKPTLAKEALSASKNKTCEVIHSKVAKELFASDSSD